MVSACVWPGKELPLGFTGRLVVLADKDERWPKKKPSQNKTKDFSLHSATLISANINLNPSSSACIMVSICGGD